MELTAEQIKLVNLVQKFFACADNGKPVCLYSLNDFFIRLQSVYPSGDYLHSDVYQVITYLGFEFINSTSGKILFMVWEN